MGLLAAFFDENSHFGMGGFEVDREIVMAEAFAGGGADGGNEQVLECRTKWLYPSVFL